MRCIGEPTEEYRSRMYALRELYARPMSRAEPVICIDEKRLELIGHSRAPLPMDSRSPEKVDCEVRKGTTNLFVAVEPKAGRRTVSVTERQGKADFVAFVGDLLNRTYTKARRVHLVLGNLSIHFRKCFEDVLGKRAATKLLRRAQFHDTPKHASGLNMAEIEIGVLDRQCLDRRIENRRHLQRVAASSKCRTANHRVDVHPSGCGSETQSTLRSDIYVLRYWGLPTSR